MNMVNIGVMGYSDGKFDKEFAKTKLLIGIGLACTGLYSGNLSKPNPTVNIVSGYTDIGIPSIAYKIADNMGFRKTGIACKLATQYPLAVCDEIMIVGDTWGDESQVFIDYCDIFVVIGGGDQTKSEMKMASDQGKRVIYFELEREV